MLRSPGTDGKKALATAYTEASDVATRCRVSRHRTHRCRQRRADVVFDLEAGEIVAARAAPVDDRNREARLMGHARETEARVHHERRTRDEQRVRAGERLARALVPIAWHVFPEKDDVRLEQAAATLAARRAQKTR